MALNAYNIFKIVELENTQIVIKNLWENVIIIYFFFY